VVKNFSRLARLHRFAEEAPLSNRTAVNSDESKMRKLDLDAMDFDELWLLHEELTKLLAEKISAEKHKLEKRLAQLSHGEQVREGPSPPEERRADRPRRKYPKVLPKYFNPSAPMETWSGRGKQPRWLVAALRSGHKLEDLRIPAPKEATGTRARRGQRS
jgi:DNA-binding protein H-NS